MPKDNSDDQARLDAEDVQLRLDRLADALAEEHAAKELVRNAEHSLRSAKSALEAAHMRVVELSFIERRKRQERRGCGDGR